MKEKQKTSVDKASLPQRTLIGLRVKAHVQENKVRGGNSGNLVVVIIKAILKNEQMQQK